MEWYICTVFGTAMISIGWGIDCLFNCYMFRLAMKSTKREQLSCHWTKLLFSSKKSLKLPRYSNWSIQNLKLCNHPIYYENFHDLFSSFNHSSDVK